jgi:small subunit ribosomal protein S16
MVRIRLRRIGQRHQPSYRVIAADKESPRDGRFLEILGSYNPRTQPFTLEVDEARIFAWMSQGAQPSESVASLFRQVGLLDRYARFKAGESAEALAAEARAYYENRKIEKSTLLAAKQ